jgi:hypothetical protein
MLWVRIFVPARLCIAFDVVVGLYRMLWVRFFVPARLCIALDVVVRMLSYIMGTNFSPRREEGVSWKKTAFRGEVFQGTASYPIDISLG